MLKLLTARIVMKFTTAKYMDLELQIWLQASIFCTGLCQHSRPGMQAWYLAGKLQSGVQKHWSDSSQI